MAIGVGDVVRITAGLLDARGNDVQNTFDVEIQTAGSSGNDGFQNDMLEIMTDLYATVAGIIDDSAVADTVYFYQRNGLEVLLPKAWASPPVFTAGGDELVMGASGVIILRTNRRGTLLRKFIGPMVEGFNVSGAPNSTCLLTLADMADFLLASHTGSRGWEVDFVCWPSVGTGAIPLIDRAVSPLWGQQSRRRAGRGS